MNDPLAKLTCEVCKRPNTEHPVVGVCSSTLGPFSQAICAMCLVNRAEPYGIMSFTYDEIELADKPNGGVAPWVKELKTFKDGKYLTWDEFVADYTSSKDTTSSTDVPKCGICNRPLTNDDPLRHNCGGDCLRCMALVAEDPDCIPETIFRLAFRAGVYAEGGGVYEVWSYSMKASEDAAWTLYQEDAMAFSGTVTDAR